MLRRANKIRVALGGEAGTANWIAERPKGMWNRTYLDKVNQIIWAERQADLAFLSYFEGKVDVSELREMLDFEG